MIDCAAMAKAPASVKAVEKRLSALGAGPVVAGLHTLLGVEERFLRGHVLPAGLAYDPALHEEALEALRPEALRENPRALALRGRLLRALGRIEEALEALSRSLALEDAPETRGWRGEALVNRRDGLEEGLAELEAAGRAAPRDPRPWLWAAAARLRDSAGPETFAALEAALRADPGCVPALLMRAEAQRRVGKKTKGLADAVRAVRLEPACVGARLIQGDLEAELGRKAAALKTYGAASRLDPDVKNRYAKLLPGENLSGVDAHLKRHPRDAWAYALRGDALRGPGTGGDEPGMADLARAVKLDPKTPWIRACLGRSRVQYKYPEEGIADLEKALSQDPRCAWLNSWMAECCRRTKRREPALRHFKKAIALDPEFAQAHLWLGRLHCDDGRWEEGAAEFSAAIRLNRSYGLAYAKRGDALAKLRRHAEAVLDFDRALNFQVPYGGEWILDLRGRSRLALGDFAGACNDLAEVARRKPRISWVPLPHGGQPKTDAAASREALTALDAAIAQHYRRGPLWAWKGAVLLAYGRGDEALECLDRAVELEPSFAWAFGWRGRALWLAGRPQDERGLDRALSLDLATPWLWSWRAELRLGGGDVEGALTDSEKALELFELDAHANYCRGEALRRAGGKPREAKRALDRAVEFDRSFAPSFISRGVVLGELGDLEGQLRDFRQAAKLSPELFRRKLSGEAARLDVEALLARLLEEPTGK
jgi:tetratricopeptide (TPR) repeat protein